ncbi:hypothetical protein ACQKWADRAFT_285591 [Trichoderma austrokoningii]
MYYQHAQRRVCHAESRIVVSSAFYLSVANGQSLAVAQVTSHPRLTLNDWNYYAAPIIPYPEWYLNMICCPSSTLSWETYQAIHCARAERHQYPGSIEALRDRIKYPSCRKRTVTTWRIWLLLGSS